MLQHDITVLLAVEMQYSQSETQSDHVSISYPESVYFSSVLRVKPKHRGLQFTAASSQYITEVLSTDHSQGSNPEQYEAQVGNSLSLCSWMAKEYCLANMCKYACRCSTKWSLV